MQVKLVVREARSLKDKRQVVKSIKDRLRNAYNISVAEVDAEEKHQLVVLGIAMVSNESAHLQSTLQTIVENLRRHPIAEFIDQALEVMEV